MRLRQRARGIRLTAIAVTGLCASCSLETEAPPSSLPAQVLILNASASATNVTTYYNGNQLAVLGYKQTSQCVLEPAGTSAFSFAQDGFPLAAVNIPLDGGLHYTIVLTNKGSVYRAVGLGDEANLPTTSTGIRLINTTATAADVYVMPPGDLPNATNKAASGLQPFATPDTPPGYVVRPNSNTHVMLFDVGSTTNARADFTIGAINSSRLTSVIFIEKVAPSDPGAFQVDPCNSVIQ